MAGLALDELRKFVAPEFVFGNGARHLAGQYAVFDEVTPNPRDHQVMEGARRYARERCNAIVAVGGGSTMDCAKGIGIVATSGGHIRDYEGVDRIDAPTPILVCVPTTAGSSADVSPFAIVSNTEDEARRYKLAIISKAVVPDIVVDDEEMLRHFVSRVPAAQGYHVVEAADGEDALAVLERHVGDIDLLVTDVVMPRLSGAAPVERVRLRRAQLPVVFLSGLSDRATLPEGEWAALAKPFGRKELLATVREVLDRPAGP